MPSYIDLLLAEAPPEEFDALLHRAEQAADPAAERLGSDLQAALHVRDTIARLRTREARLSALYATANDLTGIRDVDEILQAIVRRARQLLGTDIAYLGLNVPAEGAAYVRVTDGAVSASFRNLKLPLGTGLLGLVAQSGAPYATPDYHTDERFAHREYIDEAVSDESIRAILGVPMTVGGDVIGALLAANRTPRPFPAEEVELLSSFAAHAAIALDNARHVQETTEAHERLRLHSDSVEMAASVHDRLTEVLVGGGSPADVAALLADSLAAEVAVLDEGGRPVAQTPGQGRTPPDDLGPAVAESLSTGHAVRTGSDNAALATYVAAAAAGGDHLATLVVSRATALDLAEQRTLDRGALGVAVLMLFARTVAEAEGRVRADLLDDLLDGRQDLDRLAERARLQGLDLDTELVVCVVDVDGADRRRAVSAMAALTTEHAGLSGLRESEVVVVLPAESALPTGRRVAERLASLTSPVTVGVAGPAPSADRLAPTYRAARQCVRTLLALGRPGAVADPASTGFARLLLGPSGTAEVEEFLHDTIGPLLSYDTIRGTELAATVDAWFDCSGSAAAAAKRLHLHANTVVQRLERVSALLGDDWRAPDRSLDVRLALRVWRMRHLIDT